ncbi:glutamate decarboxylase [Purpureocillium lilacinum]|uniref:Glutamate decarboxylase n=1 Tax=Purpureocillium lilacinum TaxID=33203 RepID=A0A179H7K9_PURLI|nr:glutamate decarboxylase [Purpureocillium lilacinum]OAQ77088.1 glutamate decarboxylase [Purpureocillium lilacinum]OAQ85902.1 glutamate decarboxylase [Purpureocillium lilacinum]
MGSSQPSPLGEDLDALCTTLQSILPRLLTATHNVKNQPLFKVAQKSDYAHLRQLSTPGPPSDINQVIDDAFAIADFRARMSHPRAMAFIPSPVSPYAWLGDVLASAFNTFAGSRLQGSGSSIVEKTMIDWLAAKVGLPETTAGGVFVSGGSMGNLLAMALARDHRLPRGQQSSGVIYVSEQTHHSVSKGLRILGFHSSQIHQVPSDETFRLDPVKLAQAIQADRDAGLAPFVVVASCGTTNTGAIDPLAEIAELCKRKGIWLHVDGAYGASASLSATHSHLTAGLCHADSISWDAHKWLFQTYNCGILLVRDKTTLLESFASQGDYLRDALADDEVPNFWDCGLELTRGDRATRLWFTLRVLGEKRFGEMIDHGFSLAEAAEEELGKLPDWEIVSPASMAILAFRFAPSDTADAERNELNVAISKRLVAENTAGILTTKLRGVVVMRLCAISPSLGVDEMRGIVREMDRLARQVCCKPWNP